MDTLQNDENRDQPKQPPTDMVDTSAPTVRQESVDDATIVPPASLPPQEDEPTRIMQPAEPPVAPLHETTQPLASAEQTIVSQNIDQSEALSTAPTAPSEQYSHSGQYPTSEQYLTQPSQHPASGQYPPINQYPQPGQYPPVNQYPQPGQYLPQTDQYSSSGQYPPMNQYPLPSSPGYAPQGVGMPMQGNQPPARQPRQKKLSKLTPPLPRPVLLACIGLVVILLIVVQLLGKDWGDGAANASHVALWIGVVLVLALLIRTFYPTGMASSLNPTRVRQYIGSFIAIIVIFIYSGVSQALVLPLHTAQGHFLEGQAKWQPAIDEYKLSGEKAPDGANLARTYTSWGLALSQSHNYDQAISKFAIVIGQFTNKAVSDQLTRAQNGDISARQAEAQQSVQAKQYSAASNAYTTMLGLPYCNQTCLSQAQSGNINAQLALAQQSVQAKSYSAATITYDAILALSYCDTTCSQKVDPLDATAYYNAGETQLQANNYTDTVTLFDVILTKFPNAPEAKQLHADMAKALMGKGQSTLASNCSDALPIYQRLGKDFGDTPEGQAANQALSAPQKVTGHFTNTETTVPFDQIALTQGLQGGIAHDDLFNKWDSANLKVSIQGNGNFEFDGVAPGDYDLFWSGNDGTYMYVEFIYSVTTSVPTYIANVAPLCGVDMGEVSNAHGVGTSA